MKHNPLKKIAWILAMLLLAGCHKLEITTQIESNGSGELKTGVGYSAEERASLEKQHNSSQDFCNTSMTTENVTEAEEQRGDETWCVTTIQFATLDELRALYEQREITVNRLEIRDGKLYYDVSLGASPDDPSSSIGTQFTWSVLLPGAPISHNADQVDGNTLVWTPAPQGQSVDFQAESEAPRRFNFPSCGTALIGFGMVFVYLRKPRFGFS